MDTALDKDHLRLYRKNYIKFTLFKILVFFGASVLFYSNTFEGINAYTLEIMSLSSVSFLLISGLTFAAFSFKKSSFSLLSDAALNFALAITIYANYIAMLIKVLTINHGINVMLSVLLTFLAIIYITYKLKSIFDTQEIYEEYEIAKAIDKKQKLYWNDAHLAPLKNQKNLGFSSKILITLFPITQAIIIFLTNHSLMSPAFITLCYLIFALLLTLNGLLKFYQFKALKLFEKEIKSNFLALRLKPFSFKEAIRNFYAF